VFYVSCLYEPQPSERATMLRYDGLTICSNTSLWACRGVVKLASSVDQHQHQHQPTSACGWALRTWRLAYFSRFVTRNTLNNHVLCALPCMQMFERECNREKTLEKVAKENKVR